MPIAKLPIGIQDFGEIITGGYTYIDKTELIHKIITEGKPYFLSRPRRFGKSLLISTFEALFSAKRDLFKGLWIDKSDWEWKSYPIIRLDMSKLDSTSPDKLEISLKTKLEEIAENYDLQLIQNVPLSLQLDRLITDISKQGQVVVLIDEYDKPLIDRLGDIELAKKNREILRQFYTIFKSQDANLKFIFLTGVTKFSKVSVFSGLNNLSDLTMLDQYSTLLGYTKEELKQYFDPDIQELAKANNLELADCYQKIKEWYNGYRFSKSGDLVYNPFSVLRLLNSKDFSAHWFETGTPTFLIELIKQRKFDLIDLEQLKVDSASFSTFEIEDIPTLPLLYQTGYLTIKHHEPILDTFRLGYPNREVSEAFSQSLLRNFATAKAESTNYVSEICENLLENTWDEKVFFDRLERLLALIPYDLFIKQEKHYQSLFYLIFKLAGIKVSAEVHTQRGRVDASIEMHNKIIIFEFKLNKSAAVAIEQIKAKRYFDNFSDRQLPIYLVGINFNSETRSMDDWLVEVWEQ